MKGTVLGIAMQGDNVMVKVKNSNNGFTNTNKLENLAIGPELKASIGKEIEIQLKQTDELDDRGKKIFVITGLGPYEKKPFSGGSKGGYKEYKKDPAESKRIVFQNSMAHATAISLHNAALSKKTVDVDDVIAMATSITDIIMAESKAASLKENSDGIVSQEVVESTPLPF
jgi:hypothetical protein